MVKVTRLLIKAGSEHGFSFGVKAWTEMEMLDVLASKAHQNNRSYVSSADLPSDSLRKNLAWRTSKNHKIGGGRLLGTIR